MPFSTAGAKTSGRVNSPPCAAATTAHHGKMALSDPKHARMFRGADPSLFRASRKRRFAVWTREFFRHESATALGEIAGSFVKRFFQGPTQRSTSGDLKRCANSAPARSGAVFVKSNRIPRVAKRSPRYAASRPTYVLRQSAYGGTLPGPPWPRRRSRVISAGIRLFLQSTFMPSEACARTAAEL